MYVDVVVCVYLGKDIDGLLSKATEAMSQNMAYVCVCVLCVCVCVRVCVRE